MPASRRLALFVFIVTIFVATVAHAEPDQVADFEETPEKPLTKGWSLELGAMFAFNEMGIDPVTGDFSSAIDIHLGFELGLHYQFLGKHSIGAWGNVGAGGYSMVFISHFGFGLDYTYGDKVNGFAMGPMAGLTSAGPVFGVQLFYRAFYLKAGMIAAGLFREHADYGGMFSIGYSIFFGKKGS